MDESANTRMQQTCQAWSTRYRRYSLFSFYPFEVDGGTGYGRCCMFLAQIVHFEWHQNIFIFVNRLRPRLNLSPSLQRGFTWLYSISPKTSGWEPLVGSFFVLLCCRCLLLGLERGACSGPSSCVHFGRPQKSTVQSILSVRCIHFILTESMVGLQS